MTDESKDPFIMTNPGLFVKKTVTVFLSCGLDDGNESLGESGSPAGSR